MSVYKASVTPGVTTNLPHPPPIEENGPRNAVVHSQDTAVAHAALSTFVQRKQAPISLPPISSLINFCKKSAAQWMHEENPKITNIFIFSAIMALDLKDQTAREQQLAFFSILKNQLDQTDSSIPLDDRLKNFESYLSSAKQDLNLSEFFNLNNPVSFTKIMKDAREYIEKRSKMVSPPHSLLCFQGNDEVLNATLKCYWEAAFWEAIILNTEMTHRKIRVLDLGQSRSPRYYIFACRLHNGSVNLSYTIMDTAFLTTFKARIPATTLLPMVQKALESGCSDVTPIPHSKLYLKCTKNADTCRFHLVHPLLIPLMPYDSSETNMFIVYTKNFSKLKKTPLDPRIDAVVKLKQALDTILPSGAPTVRLQTFKTYLSGLPKNQPDMSKLLDLENQFSREMIVQDAQEYFDKQRLMILSPEIDPEIYQGFRGDFDSFFWDIIRSNVPKKERVIEFGSSLYILRGVRQADGKVSLSISLVDISVFDRVKIPVPKTSILLPIVAEAIKKGLSSLYQTTYYTKYLWCAQDENGIYKFQVC